MPRNRQYKQNRRGAPKGNANALRHGFYSRQFKTIIQQDLDGHKFTGLSDQITLLRVFIRQTIELIGQPKDVKEALDGLHSLSSGFFSLSRLVRTHHIISLAGDGTNSLLDRAIDEVLKEMEAEDSQPGTAPVPVEGCAAKPEVPN